MLFQNLPTVRLYLLKEQCGKELNKSGYKFQSLFGADGKVVTDWVTIKPNTAPEKYNLLIMENK